MPRKLKPSLAFIPDTWDSQTVKIFGPYAPNPGRNRWRVQLYDATGAKKSVTFPNRTEAEEFIAALRLEIDGARITIREGIDEFIAHKRPSVTALSASQIAKRLIAFLPGDAVIRGITPVMAEEIYERQTRRIGKFGQIKAATHQAGLRTTKEFFAFLVRKGLSKGNPFADVEPIGRVNCGKPQPTETEAKRLDDVLFQGARGGDEGALALLVQLYLGLRSSEVLKLEVGAVEREGRKVTVVRGKTRNAKRSLELYPDVAALLWKLCEGRNQAERVFARHLSSCPKPDYMYKRLKRFCAAAGIRSFCPHSLRGLHSSLAVVSGATSHEVAKSLGHANFSTTARHYLNPSALDNARGKAFASVMRGEDNPQTDIGNFVSSLTPTQREALLAALTK